MIKAPYSLVELDQMANDFYRKIIVELDMVQTITNRALDELTPIFNYLLAHLRDIITGQPSVLELQKTALTPFVNQAKKDYLLNHPGVVKREVNKWFKNQVLMVFNYDYNHLSFAKRYNGRLAYEHAMKLNITTCPYCNAQFTFTLKNKKNKTRPTFDHFIAKSKHPYFSLSFYNLIPSCYVCNSSIKSSSIFTHRSHMHPFLEGMTGVVEFVTGIDAVDYLVNKNDFTIKIKGCAGADPATLKRADKSIKDFAIEDRYNFHKDYAGEIITKAYFYNNSKISELLNDFSVAGKSIFSSKREIVEMLLGNVIHEDYLHKRILSKLTRDIAKEVGLVLQ